MTKPKSSNHGLAPQARQTNGSSQPTRHSAAPSDPWAALRGAARALQPGEAVGLGAAWLSTAGAEKIRGFGVGFMTRNGGFLGDPSWMVYFRENPMKMDEAGGTPMTYEIPKYSHGEIGDHLVKTRAGPRHAIAP